MSSPKSNIKEAVPSFARRGVRATSMAMMVACAFIFCGVSKCEDPKRTGEQASIPCDGAQGSLSAGTLRAFLSNTKYAKSDAALGRLKGYFDYVYKQVGNYPALMNMHASRTNGLCPRYNSFSEGEKRAMWAKTLMALAKSESDFNRGSLGTDTVQTARGILQLAQASVSGYGCRLSGDLSALDCALKILSNNVTERQGLLDPRPYYKGYKETGRTIKKRVNVGTRKKPKWEVHNVPVYAWRTEGFQVDKQQYWSNLRPGYVYAPRQNGRQIRPFHDRFLPFFKQFVPECRARF